MSTEALMALWAKSGRPQAVESTLRDALLARGTPLSQLEAIASARVALRPQLSSAAAVRLAQLRADKTSESNVEGRATAVFWLVLFAQIGVGAVFLLRMDEKAFYEIMLVSMGLGYLPFVLAISAAAVVAVLAKYVYLAITR
jgi:hypothetical protein